MKLGPVSKLDKRNTEMSKKFYDHVMSVNFDVILSFQIYDQSREIEKPDFGRMICNTYISVLRKLKTELKIHSTALMVML